jgi:3-hydroxybutyryl-CoA dehydratase
MHDVLPLPERLAVGEGYRFEDLAVGMTAAFTKIITDADLVMFAGISGDTNPVHFDEGFARTTTFKGRIAHGMLTASLISTVLGTKLPGPGCIYLSQNIKFLAAVMIGDTVEARATVADINTDKRRIVMKTACTVRGKPVIDGEALIWVPAKDA